MAMSPKKQQQIRDARKKEILQKAMILFDTQGYRNTKITDISESLGISKGLVYRYYKSKEEILLAICDKLTYCIQECAKVPHARDGLILFGKRLLYYPYFENYVPPLRILFSSVIRGDIEPEILDGIVGPNFGENYFGSLFRKGQEQGDFRDGDPIYFGNLFWNYLVGYLANMPIRKDGIVCKPDIEAILKIFEY